MSGGVRLWWGWGLLTLLAGIWALCLLHNGASAVADSSGLVCFSSDLTGSQEIYTMGSDGSNLHQLTSTSAYNENYGDYAPDLSPDGTSIVYLHNPRFNDAPGQLFVMRSDGSGAHRITYLRMTPYEPRFSPDGTKIVFQTTSALYTIDADGSHLHKVLASPHSEIFGPSFSPDGRSIAFAWKRQEAITGRFQIYTVGVDGGRRWRLTRGAGNAQAPTFSPDGGTIAFVKGIEAHKHGTRIRVTGSPQIYAMQPDGGDQRQLTHNPHGSTVPAFSPDGSEIVYAANTAGAWNSTSASYAVHVMQSDGSEDRLLTTPLGHLGWLSWKP